MNAASYLRSDGTRYLVSTDGRVYELRPTTLTHEELKGLATIGYLKADASNDPPASEPAGKGVRRSTSSGKTLALV
jgi:hypothetical protein